MRSTIVALLASAPLTLASQNVFSVHDDLLAYPQYEVIFSGAILSEEDASSIIAHASPTSSHTPKSADMKSLESQSKPQSSPATTHHEEYPFDPSRETYELMYHNGEHHLCTIPIINTPIKNETSEAEARAAEQKELARATDRGWELLQELGDGKCLYYHAGWWSYAFCYNKDIVQFHSLPSPAGKLNAPPQRDPTTKQFVLGRAKPSHHKEDEWVNQIEGHKGPKAQEPLQEEPKTELQVKGDQRYLVQKMEGGTTCDLTGKPRRIEIQYHCNAQVRDRIGYIKEVTTCSYLMVVYTNRLCDDVAFVPPKPDQANQIICRVIVPESELASRTELETLASKKSSEEEQEAEKVVNGKKPPITIGGLVIGAGKFVNKAGQRMPIPPNFGTDSFAAAAVVRTIIAQSPGGGPKAQIESLPDADLVKMDLEPDMVEQLRREVQKMAGDKGWKIEVVDQPGQVREILGIVDSEDDEEEGLGDEDEEGGKGSEEGFYRDEL